MGNQFVLRRNTNHSIINDNCSAVIFNQLTKFIYKEIASSFKSVTTIDIQHIDNGMDVCWGFILLSTIERIHICKYRPKFLILDIFCYEIANRDEEILRMHEDGRFQRTEMKHVHFIEQSIHCINIFCQCLTLVWEILN